MDDRKLQIIGILLMMAVAIVPTILFSDRNAPPLDSITAPAESMTVFSNPVASNPAPSTVGPATVAEQPELITPPPVEAATASRTVSVSSGLYEYEFQTQGIRLSSATMRDHPSLLEGDDRIAAQLIPEDSEFLTYAMLLGNDTVSLSDWHFEPSTERVELSDRSQQITWTGQLGQVRVTLTQTFQPNSYLFDITGRIDGLGENSPLLLINLGPRLRMIEADARTEARAIGVVTKTDKTRSTRYDKFESVGVESLDGPFEWVAVKSKYFLAAVLSLDEGSPRFGGGVTRGTGGKNEAGVHVTATLPVTGNLFSHSVYVGPQEYKRLSAIGHDLEDANPYGWIFRPIIRPISNLALRALVWGHDTLNLRYGWLVILFGILIRVAIMPLHGKALRSQMAMQAVQPEIAEIKKKYPDNAQKTQEETMKLFKEKGINPLGGCLPMLLPMPIMLAFFFVFMNAIELRGVSFWWLPDLSAKDPLYIIPLVMGGSMFLVSKLGQVGVPPNPQAKMMMYVMPVMMTVFFLNFASGLNLYYATQNLASLPQQWFIGRERLNQKAKS